MDWAAFWAMFSQAHLVSLFVNNLFQGDQMRF
jgi:hypothetical protein